MKKKASLPSALAVTRPELSGPIPVEISWMQPAGDFAGAHRRAGRRPLPLVGVGLFVGVAEGQRFLGREEDLAFVGHVEAVGREERVEARSPRR